MRTGPKDLDTRTFSGLGMRLYVTIPKAKQGFIHRGEGTGISVSSETFNHVLVSINTYKGTK